jgi:mono/diheme cytochrome c family protein
MIIAIRWYLISARTAVMRFAFLLVRSFVFPPLCLLALLASMGCQVERRKSDAELGLDPTQAMGRHVFDADCARCHEPYSSRGLHGPSLHNVYKKEYLPSGMPANDERITAVIVRGRAKMPAFGNTLADSQIDALLAYLKTL